MLDSLAGLAVLLLEGLAVCVIAAIGYGVYILTHPHRRSYASAVARGRPGHPGEIPGRLGEAPRKYESWTFRSRGRDLPVWDIPGDKPSGPTIVLSHGWGDSRIGALTRVPALLPHAARLIAWDMPGHGEAPGRCTLGTREPEDLLALVERVSEPGRPIVLFGWSLGAIVSIAAAHEPVASAPGRTGDLATPSDHAPHATIDAVIAEAPYRLPWVPARNVMRLRALPYRWNIAPTYAILGLDLGVGMRWQGFDRAEHAAKLPCPLLVLHGTDDAVCPIQDGRDIARAAPRATLIELPAAQHSGLWTESPHKEACAAAVAGFLSSLR